MTGIEEDAKLVNRVGETGEFIKVVEQKCTGCGRCAVVCPMALWKIRTKKAQITDDYTKKCMECGSCWQACKYDAIDFSFPKGGTGIVVAQG